MNTISLSDFPEHIQRFFEKSMSIGSETGAQTWNRTDLSAASLKTQSTDKKIKKLTPKP